MDIKANRLARLREIIDTKFGGNAGQCADFFGIKRPQMSRWVTKNATSRQGIAEESARAMEKKLSLSHGWFDLPVDTANLPALQHPAEQPSHTHKRKLVDRLCRLAEKIDDLGLMYLIGKAEEVMKQHPHDESAVKQTAA